MIVLLVMRVMAVAQYYWKITKDGRIIPNDLFF